MSSSLVPSYVVTFREALEAALVVAIVASYLNRVGSRGVNKYLYLGVVAAVVASVLLGIAISTVYGELAGASGELFEGAASLTAMVVLTYMILWMNTHARTLTTELEHKVETAVTAGQTLGIVAVSFLAVFREGVETVLFMTTLAITDSVGTLIGAIMGSATVILLAVFLVKGIYRLDISRFFQVTSIVLIVFAAGLAAHGVHELMEAGEGYGINLGILAEPAFDINPPLNPDGTYPPLHSKGAVGSVLAALVGYSGNPEWLRVIVYIGYWLVLGSYVLITRRGKQRTKID